MDQFCGFLAVPGDSNLTKYQSQVQDSRTQLFRTLVIRIGWALRVNFSRILQN